MLSPKRLVYLVVLWVIVSSSTALAYIDDKNTTENNYIVYENRHTLNFPQLIAELERGATTNPLIRHFMFLRAKEGVTFTRSLSGVGSTSVREISNIALRVPGRNPTYIEELNPDYYLEEFLKSIAMNATSPEELASSISSDELKDRIHILIQLASNNLTKPGEIYNEIVYAKNLAEYLYATGEISVAEYLITMKILKELAEENNLKPLYRNIEESIAKILAEILAEAGREEALRRLLKSPVETVDSTLITSNEEFRFRNLLNAISRFARSNYPQAGSLGNFTLLIPLLNTQSFQFLGYAALASVLLVLVSIALLTFPVALTKTELKEYNKKVSTQLLRVSKTISIRSSIVINLYWRAVEILSRNISRKYEWETHREYLYKIRPELRRRSSKLGESFEKLTLVYEKVRFGKQSQHKAEEEAKRSYDSISSYFA